MKNMILGRSLFSYRNVIAVLAVCAAVLLSADVQAATKEDLNDPDYVKRYYQEKSMAAAGNAGAARTVPADGTFTDKKKNKYTGKKYTHSDAFRNCEILNGIDISRHNGNVDWKKVKADGIDFTILRIGYSRLNTDLTPRITKSSPGKLRMKKDENFDMNLAGVQEAGLPLGIYYFSQSVTVKEAKKEAEYVIKLLNEAGLDGKKLQLPVVFDSEMTPGGRLSLVHPNKTTYTNMAKAFCEKIKAAGYTPMVYSGYYGLRDNYNGAELSNLYNIWYARYNTNTYYNGKYMIWQYASGGEVDGCPTTVDMNFYYRPKSSDSLTESSDEAKQVSGLSVKQVSSSSLSLSFKAISSADGYIVQRSGSADGPFFNIVTVTDTSYKDTGLKAGKEYFYRIKAKYSEDGKSVTGPASAVAYAATKANGTKKIKITTAAHVRTKAGVSHDTLGFVQAGTKLRVYAVTENDEGLTWYKVRPTINGKTVTGYVSARCADVALGKVKNLKKKKSASKSVTIKWKAVGGADGYEIWASDAPNGTYRKAGEVSGKCSFKHMGLKKYTEYYYKVRAVCHVDAKDNYGKFSSVRVFGTKRTKAKYTSTGAASLRKYAGTKYRKLCTIPGKKTMTAYYRTKDKAGTTWYHVKVKVGGRTYKGYVSGKLVRKK